jgi:hypothetical protein
MVDETATFLRYTPLLEAGLALVRASISAARLPCSLSDSNERRPMVAWTMPAYELAMLTAKWGEHHHPDSSCVTLLTPEREPLEAFGRAVSEGVRVVLD